MKVSFTLILGLVCFQLSAGPSFNLEKPFQPIDPSPALGRGHVVHVPFSSATPILDEDEDEDENGRVSPLAGSPFNQVFPDGVNPLAASGGQSPFLSTKSFFDPGATDPDSKLPRAEMRVICFFWAFFGIFSAMIASIYSYAVES